MRVIDLSHDICEAMPFFPGTEAPRIVDSFTIDHHGFAEKSIQFVSHTGTHIDAPCHILPGAATLDRFEIGHFIGPGLVLDVSRIAGRKIEVADLEKEESRISVVDFVLFHSGWARHWGDAAYFGSYPVLSATAASWITGFKLKGAGVDAISMDEADSASLTVHRTLLAKNMVIVENLVGLEALIGKEFVFSCLPLKIKQGDGSPVRAVAILK